VKTSYFFSPKLTIDDDLVSVAGLAPKNFTDKFPNSLIYKPLVPPKQLVHDYKSKKISEKEYTKAYKEQLSKLDPVTIYYDLEDSIILCWENPGKFCHRLLIAKWLESTTGETISEL